MKYILKVIFLLFISNLLWAQETGQKRIDSLLLSLKHTNIDSTKIKIYHELFSEYQTNDLDQANLVIRNALLLSLKHSDKSNIAKSYLKLGRLFSDKNVSDSAIYYYKKSISISEEIKNHESIASNYVNIGSVYFKMADWTNALVAYNKALAISDQYNYSFQKITALTNIAGIYFYQKDYPRTKDFLLKALAIDQKDTLITILDGLSQVTTVLRDTTEAIKYLTSSMSYYKKHNDSIGIAQTMSNMAALQKNPEDAISQLLLAKGIFERVNPDDYYVITNLGQIGIKYHAAARNKKGSAATVLLNESRKYFLKAIEKARVSNSANELVEILENLIEVEEALGDFRSTTSHMRYLIQLKDSIYSQDIKNEIAQKANLYDISIRDKKIEVKELDLKNSRNQRVGLIVTVLLLSIIGGLLYNQNRLRKRKNKELDESNKVKARFFSILSHDLRAPVASLNNYIYLLNEEEDIMEPEVKKAHQHKIGAATNNLLSTMEDILLWSKSQMERFEPVKKNVPVAQLFEDVQKLIPQDIDIDISFQHPDGLKLHTDENYLTTIMRNLTANAIKALKDKTAAKIEWKAWQQNGKTYLSITDNGPGLSQEQKEKMFNDNAIISTKTGLGIHLVRDLIKMLQHQMDVQSEPGKGTTFTITVV